jgi:hypothetical protein
MEKPGPNKSEDTNQKPVGGFLIAHFKRYVLKGNSWNFGKLS